MKLKTFDIESVPVVRSYTPAIHINTKTGLFTFNKSACTLLGLVENDHVIFHQDEDDSDWYIEKVKENGFLLRSKKDESNGLVFNNAALSRMLFESVECSNVSGRILIAGQHTKVGKQILYGLLTASLNSK